MGILKHLVAWNAYTQVTISDTSYTFDKPSILVGSTRTCEPRIILRPLGLSGTRHYSAIANALHCKDRYKDAL